MQAFLAAGLTLDHINAHHHFHLHPVVLPIVVDLARRYRAPAVRVPFERSMPPYRGIPLAATMMPWALRARRRLRRSGIATNDALFGLYDTGTMTEAAWLRIIPRIGPGLTEVYCHPARSVPGTPGEPSATSRSASELAALMSPRVRTALDRAGIRRTAFATAGDQ